VRIVAKNGAEVHIIGGGLAGCEAAFQLARVGIPVCLTEMRPDRPTPVHTTGNLAELVCSNSLRGDGLGNAVGLLKREMEVLDSLVMRVARAAAVPAGGALAVDRQRFSEQMTAAVEANPLITVERREITQLGAGRLIVATGPLTTPALHRELETILGEGALAFFDAIAPVVAADSLNMDRLFRASRYDKGGGDDYLNAAMTQQEYERFVDELRGAKKVEFKQFESAAMRYFEGCLPIEVMAERGRDTLRFGPLKPVGLVDPSTGRRPWAALQLRQDDLAAEHWNLVGCQTKLTQSEQKRVFRLIPGLENARFVRLGMIHRNTFVNAPAHLAPDLRLTSRPEIRLAGQVTGVEGYVESAATGLLAGRFAAAGVAGFELAPPPAGTASAGLIRHLTERPSAGFQPSNITWGLIPCLEDLRRIRNKRERRESQAQRALELIAEWAERPLSPRAASADDCAGARS
jgi:methylenetetrahydrofolate--tRNA-(uracil-5-)-methyltransferase